MNAVNARLLTCVATTALGLLCIGQTALAEQTAFAQGNCKEAKGNLNEVFFIGDNFNSGILRNGGWLNGTTVVVFTGAPLIPLPGIVVFTGQFTLTTDHGQLKASNVYLLGLAANKSTVLAVIDPAGSTGRFAGATGTLFLNTNRVDVSGNPHAFQSEVHVEVCFIR